MPLRIIIIVLVVFTSGANSGKVIWGKDGKPIIEKPQKPIKGCQAVNPLEGKLGKPIQNPILKPKKKKCNK